MNEITRSSAQSVPRSSDETETSWDAGELGVSPKESTGGAGSDGAVWGPREGAVGPASGRGARSLREVYGAADPRAEEEVGGRGRDGGHGG